VSGRAHGSSSSVAVPRRTVLWTAAATLAASVVAACGSGRRQSPSPASANTVDHGAIGLAIVGILTADINPSLRFYRQLGLDVPKSTGDNSYRLRMADNHVVFWETAAAVHAFDPSWALPPTADRRIVLEFGFASPTDLEATFRSLVADGAPSYLAPIDQGGGIRYAIVEDPDGNQISLRYPAVS